MNTRQRQPSFWARCFPRVWCSRRRPTPTRPPLPARRKPRRRSPAAPHRTFNPGQRAMVWAGSRPLSDQVAQITPILADRQQKMQNLRADNSLSNQDRHTKAQAIIQDSNSKIEAVVSEAQKQQFEQMLAQRRSHQHRQAPALSQPQA